MAALRRARQPTITIDTTAVGESGPAEPEIQLHTISNPSSPQEPGNDANAFLSPVGHANFLAVPRPSSPSTSSLGGETFTPSIGGSNESRFSFGGDSTHDLLADRDALKPDPGTEQDFQVDDNPFAFSPGQLGKMYDPKSLAAFYALGGLAGIAKGLRTNLESGLNVDEQHISDAVSFDDATAVRAPAAVPVGARE